MVCYFSGRCFTGHLRGEAITAALYSQRCLPKFSGFMNKYHINDETMFSLDPVSCRYTRQSRECKSITFYLYQKKTCQLIFQIFIILQDLSNNFGFFWIEKSTIMGEKPQIKINLEGKFISSSYHPVNNDTSKNNITKNK